MSEDKAKTNEAKPVDNSQDIQYGDYVKQSWEIVKANPMPFILGWVAFSVVSSITFGIGALLIGNMIVSNHYMVKKLRKKETVVFEDVMWGFKNNFMENFLAGLVYSVGLSVGSILCLVGQFFTGALMLYMVPLIAFKKQAIGDAFNKSKEAAMKNLMNHVVFILVLTALNIAGALVCGIGLLVTIPMTYVAMALVYEDRMSEGDTL